MKDRGRGIDPGDIDRIFDAFSRPSPTDRDSAAVPHGSIFHVVPPIAEGVADR